MLAESLRYAIDAAAGLTLHTSCTAWSRLRAADFCFIAGVTRCSVSRYLFPHMSLHARSVRHGPGGMDLPLELRFCAEGKEANQDYFAM